MHGIIYCAQNLINQKIYIGQTVKTLSERKTRHRNQANSKINGYFTMAIRKYGFDNFLWCILAKENTQDKLNEAERYWIKALETMNKEYGYNLCSGGKKGGVVSKEVRKKISEKVNGIKNGFYGKKHSPETLKRMSEVKKGKKASEETKLKISKAGMGRKKTKETLEKFRATRMGHSVSEETREKMRLSHLGKTSWNKGKKHSEESKKKMSIAHMGLPAGMTGKHHSEETKQKMRLKKIGKPLSEEHKRKMSIAQKKRRGTYHGSDDS